MNATSSLSIIVVPSPWRRSRSAESTGWNREYGFTPEQLHMALRGSWRLLAAYEHGELVGSGRIVCDGVFHALIVDVIVADRLRRHGWARQSWKGLWNGAARRAFAIFSYSALAARLRSIAGSASESGRWMRRAWSSSPLRFQAPVSGLPQSEQLPVPRGGFAERRPQ